MAFEVGEVVQPTVNVVISGLEYETEGKDGTVIARELSNSIDGVDYYDYNVSMNESIVSESGILENYYIWFNDGDLGGENPPTQPVIDSIEAQDLLNSALQDTDAAVSTITQIQNNLSPNSKYVNEIEDSLTTTLNIQTVLTSTAVPSEQELENGNYAANTIIRNSNYLSNDSRLLQEWSENLAGFDSVLYEKDLEIKNTETQDSIQELAAFEDDVLNNKAFQETYINNQGSQDLLTPSTTDIDDATKTDPASLIEQGAEAIIADVPALTLEQD